LKVSIRQTCEASVDLGHCGPDPSLARTANDEEFGWIDLQSGRNALDRRKPRTAGPTFDPYDHCRRQIGCLRELGLCHTAPPTMRGDKLSKTFPEISHVAPRT
jgi:hypothetical protein